MDGQKTSSTTANFRHFFFRGLAIILPTVLTIWLLVIAYGFVRDRIANPINSGVRELVVQVTSYPGVTEQEMIEHEQRLNRDLSPKLQRWRDSGQFKDFLRLDTRRAVLQARWNSASVFLDLIGLVLAIILIYAVGVILGSFIGRRLHLHGEELVNRLPLVRRVYPSIKQVTDFFFVGNAKDRLTFNRVVAVEYPRKGIWSVGLVTGGTMRYIQDRAGHECLTIFIPSSPTPFTGYVITVPKTDVLDLPISIEDAIKFTVSGGVLIPPGQTIEPHASVSPLLDDPATRL